MAETQRLEAALRNADAAGDANAARIIAAEIIKIRKSQPDLIPVGTGDNAGYADLNAQPEPRTGQSITDALVGSAEAGLSAITGATTGAVGYGLGAIEGLAGQATGRLTADQARQTAEDYAGSLTYSPRTESGQEQVQVIADVAGALPPVVAGFTPQQLAGVGQSIRQSSSAARGIPQAVSDAIPTKTADAGLSIGAAQIPQDQVRRLQAADLPVPLKLTKGMATQDQAQQRFEIETSKNPEFGGPIRQRMAELNQGVNQNIDEFITATGTQLPETSWRLQTGNKVIEALEKGYQAEKKKVDTAYKAARARGETQEVIDVSPLAGYLNENRVDVTVAPVVGAIAKEAERIGVARGSIEDGSFQILPMTVEQSEILRQRVNALTDSANSQDLRRAAQIKNIIDTSQEQAGGQTFTSARKMRQQLANKYENLAIIDQLLDTKGQYKDQRIAAENVVSKAVINGSVEDLKNLRRALSTAGTDGLDALKEVRAAAVRHIRDEATRNVGRDPNGSPLISAAGMNKAIKALDKNGKLDLLFGKTEADKLRLLNEVTKDILVAQPNAANTSNTASVVLAAFDMMGSAATGVPAPILSALKVTRDKAKAAKTKKAVKEALE